MTDHASESWWTKFWTRGGWWRALLLAVVYLALYLGAGLLIGTLWGSQIDANLFANPQSVFLGLTLPLLVGAVLLVAFLLSIGWLKALFAPQPIRGSWWMWLGPVLVAAAVILRFLGIDYGSYQASVVIVTILTGFLVGFVEEVVTRGIAVKMLRDSGKSEWVVMVLSSLIFAVMHSTNILSGQAPLTVLLTMGFTFAFGICMYLALRVTGNLIWPIILHGLYDPTLFLSTGGIDVASTGAQSIFLTIAGPANFVYIVVAIIGLIFVRGRVQSKRADGLSSPSLVNG